ncbi:hypothetical protein V2G26_000999 [Clonostachys chloroleuca]|uniref:Non-structural maintenance of chromosomes element 1 homolog n=1 Tax=Clonostachys chloroleuca TaxID=1926264 RepID=A0AA35V9C8_9HYPO|nr:unnamed protein product [Clonostachys chloroleuca]
METLLSSGYNNGNRAFLQAIMARGALTFDEACPIIAGIWEAEGRDGRREVTEDDFADYLSKASEAASIYDYEIRTTIHQVTKDRIYAFVNTRSDPQTQLATTFALDELSFIKRLFDAMFETYNSPRMEIMAITQMQAMKVARPPNRNQTSDDTPEATQTSVDKGLKHSEVETTLSNLVLGGWLERSKEGFYSLTPRGLLELRPWLIETYNDDGGDWQRIKFCEACKELLTVGLRCNEPGCLLRLHEHCGDNFWRIHGGQTCPKCSTPFDGTRYVGERAVTQTDAYARGRRRPAKSTQGRRSSATHHADEEEDNE